jgi:hypothetical protein
MTEIAKRLRIQALQKKMEAYKAELELVEHEHNEEIESLHDEQTSANTYYEEGFFLNNQELHKLLSYLEHTIVSDEYLSGNDRKKLINFASELAWDIADHFGYDINEGTVEPSDFKFKVYASKK